MVKKTVTYLDLDGNEHTEDFMFHLNKMEVLEMNAKYNGDLVTHLEKITKEGEEDFAAVLEFLSDLILVSYGRREGDKFIKTAEMYKEFSQSEAFPEVVYAIATDAANGGADAFISAMIPSAKNH